MAISIAREESRIHTEVTCSWAPDSGTNVPSSESAHLSFGSPLNPIEDYAQTRAFCRIDHLDKANSSLKVLPEAGMAFTILAFGIVANTVSKHRFETIVVAALHVNSLIRGQACKMLPDTLTHDAGFSVIGGKALFAQDCGDVKREAFRVAGEIPSARECQIVGVARVVRAGALGEASKAAIQAIRAQVRESW